MIRFTLCSLVVSALVSVGEAAHTVTLSGSTFFRVSGPEFLNPRFDVAGGQTTVNDYTGLVEILVDGFGFSPGDYVDAFYSFDLGTNSALGLNNNSLRLGSETQIETIPSGAWSPNSSLRAEAGSLHVAALAILYDADSFSVPGGLTPLDINSGLAPVFSPDHEYHFIIDLGDYNGTVTLGLGDGFASDNSSDTYNITLWQVNEIPEPSALPLAAFALLGLAGYGWRKRQ